MKRPDYYTKCQWVYLQPQAKHCLLYSMLRYGIAPNGLPQAGLGHLYFLVTTQHPYRKLLVNKA